MATLGQMVGWLFTIAIVLLIVRRVRRRRERPSASWWSRRVLPWQSLLAVGVPTENGPACPVCHSLFFRRSRGTGTLRCNGCGSRYRGATWR